MADPVGANRKLEGWKEISEYLGIRPRTAQDYEKLRGLPVYRSVDQDKSRVWAYPAELGFLILKSFCFCVKFRRQVWNPAHGGRVRPRFWRDAFGVGSRKAVRLTALTALRRTLDGRDGRESA